MWSVVHAFFTSGDLKGFLHIACKHPRKSHLKSTQERCNLLRGVIRKSAENSYQIYPLTNRAGISAYKSATNTRLIGHNMVYLSGGPCALQLLSRQRYIA